MESSPAIAKSLQSCDSVRPHRRQPNRLPRPWDSPGKNTGVGCHFLLQRMKVKSESEFAQSCLTLHDPMDCSLPGSSVHGSFQAGVLEWGAVALPLPGIKPLSPALADRFLLTAPWGKSQSFYFYSSCRYLVVPEFVIFFEKRKISPLNYLCNFVDMSCPYFCGSMSRHTFPFHWFLCLYSGSALCW